MSVTKLFELERGDTSRKEFLKINFSSGEVKAGLYTYDFKDNEHIITYIPSLNLSAYGSTVEEANERLEEVLDDYFENLVELPERHASDELKKYGWSRDKIFKKKFEKSAYVDRDGILKNFNLSEDTKINEHFMAV